MVSFNEAAGGLAGGLLTGTVAVLAVLLFAGAVIGTAFYVRHRRKFDINVEIKSERAGGGHKIFYDRAAVLKDPETKEKYLKLLKLKMGIPVPAYNILTQTNKGDLVKLLRIGEDVFIPLRGDVIDKSYEKLDIVDSDINFWNIKRKQQHKSILDTDSILMKVLPYIPHLLGVVGIIFIMYLMLDAMPTILSEMSRLTNELASLKGAVAKTG